MTLRSFRSPIPRTKRRLAYLGMVALALLAAGVGGAAAPPARAGVSDYPATLYLSKSAATGLTGSYQLLSSGGPGVPGTPTVMAMVGGTLSGSYQYLVTQVDASGESAPSACSPTGGSCLSNGAVQGSTVSFPTPAKKSFQIGNLPTGVTVRIYRRQIGRFQLVKELVNNASATWTDDGSTMPTATILPEAENRIPSGSTGFAIFAPGVPFDGSTDATMLSSSPTTPLGQGWMVNGPGGVDFPAGQWNFNLRIRVWGGAAGSPAGETRVGAWAVKLNGTGGIQSSRLIVDPGSATDLTSTENISQTAANLFNVDYEVNLPAFYVASDEHLLFEVYRDQTAAYSGPGSTDSRLATLYSYDNVSRVARLASVGTVPNQPTLQSPADAATTDALPTLSATFSDPDSGDTGKVKFKICKASDCSDGADPVASGTSSVTTLSSGQDGAWTPGVALTTGSYYWLAKNVDANGGPSAWSTARAITIDADPPDTSITSAAPVEPTNSTAASFSFTSADAGASFECKLDSGLFAACGSPKSYSGLGAGAHTFSVRAVDSVGNQDASPATYSWNVDLTPPDVTIDSGPSNPTNASSASFAFSSTDGTATFACKLDAGSYGACTSPTSYSGIAEGTHTFSVQATDPAGNVSTASSTWDVDLTAPDISIDSGPSDPTNATAASLAFSSADSTATFECKLDTGSFAACASPAGYSGLAEGSHTFTVRATDGAGNSASASYSWQVDVTAPDTSVDSGPSDPTAGTSADLSFSANETGSTFECDLDGAGFSACTSPESYSGLADGVHVFSVRATDAAGNVDASPAVFAWTVDTAGPGRPQGFRGAVGADGLSLSWAAPLDGTPDSYILYVDGVATQTLSGTTTSRLVGAFSPNDTRRFSLAAADSLGNVGPRTAALVGVPAVQGLTVSHTRTSLEARGLRLGAVHRVLTSTRSGRIVRQAPVAPGVVRLGSPVRVGVSQRRIELKSARTLECAIGGRLSARIKLATPLSYLEARFYANGRRFDLARGFGWRRAGTRWYSLRLSYLLARPALYEVRWNTVTATGIVVSSHQWIRIRRLRAGETNPPPCSPA